MSATSTAPKVRTRHRCTACRAITPRWLGRCPECGEWASLVEEADAGVASPVPALAPGAPRPVPLDAIDDTAAILRPTGVGELDRVLGGGFGAGSVTVLGGEPGIGKSTLLLQVLGGLANGPGARCLLVSGEESDRQVRDRAARLGVLDPGVLFVAETSLAHVLAHVEELAPDVLAIDSIQTTVDPDAPGAAGSVAQVRDCAHRLVRQAKERSLTTILVGHVTKEGALAGPRALEHVVDTVLAFEGDRHHGLRTLHASKHRFGPAGEVGLLEMTGGGLVAVADPSALFLADRRTGIAGSVVAPVIEGARPMLVEIQALVAGETPPQVPPRRAAQGIDPRRLAQILAVLDRRAQVPVGRRDVFVSVAGGLRVGEAGADLAVALACAGALGDRAMPSDVVAVGEVGLAGEIRRCPGIGRRLAEARRLGFTRAVVPPSTPAVPGIAAVETATLVEAIAGALVPEGA